jgi:hypothetical protein
MSAFVCVVCKVGPGNGRVPKSRSSVRRIRKLILNYRVEEGDSKEAEGI